MTKLYEFELGKAAQILVEELFKIKAGEEFVITADTECDMRVVEATARATFAVGAKPVVIWLASPLGVGKAADPMLPMCTLTAALKEADAWVEFNNEWLLYSTPWDKAMEENRKLRYLCLVGMDADMMTRCIGRVDYPTLLKFQSKIVEMTKKAKKMRVTTPAGTDVSFKNVSGRPVTLESGYADTPGPHFLSGQIGWAPNFESINGVIAYDGSLMPPIGLLKEPVTLHVKKGKIEKIEGGKEAVQFESWLKSFKDPNMLAMAHICYGFHPGAKLTGNILEDERVWGCTEWGIGNVGPMYLPPNGKKAASHTDGICLNSSVWLDNMQLTDKGKIVHKELVGLSKKLGKA
jgi:leucyl aminopeptidase (aminopeptidase T)